MIDPGRFAAGFASRVGTLAAAILVQPGTRLPGERRLAARAKAGRDGIVIPDALAQELDRRATARAAN